MRVFIKDIALEQIEYLYKYPIQGLVFSLYQENAEKIREIIERIPFYLTIIGELHTNFKYEIEELVYFCKLNGIIMPHRDEEYSCPVILLEETPFNVFVQQNGMFLTGRVDFNELKEFTNFEALVLTIDEFNKYWPRILEIWTKTKVV